MKSRPRYLDALPRSEAPLGHPLLTSNHRMLLQMYQRMLQHPSPPPLPQAALATRLIRVDHTNSQGQLTVSL